MKLRSTTFGVALGIALPLCAQAEYVGDYAVGTDNICKVFNTYQPSTGASFTAASLAVDIYKDDNTTQDNDSGLTVDDDFDSLTGAHQVCVDTSSDGTFYSAGSMFTVVVSVGTVDSVSIVGTEVMTFSLAKTSALRPTTAGRTLDVSAGGEAGLDWSNIGSPTTSVALSGTTVDLVSGAVDDTAINSAAELQAAAAAALSAYDPPTRAELTTDKAEIMSMLGQKTTITGLSTQAVFNLSAGSADDDAYNGWGALVIDASTAGQTSLGVVSDYAGSTKTVTLCADPGVFTVANSDTIVLIPARLDCGAADATLADLALMLEDDAGTPRFTANALEEGPSGVGDWTEDERTAMRTIFGVPGSGTTPDDPTDGILDDIRDSVATRASQTSVDTLDDKVDAITAENALAHCEVNTANFAGSTTTVACILTDRDGMAITKANGSLTGLELKVLDGDHAIESRFINSTTWDDANDELQLTLSRALPATLADGVTAIIR